MPGHAKPDLLTKELILVHSLKKAKFAHMLVAQCSYVSVREKKYRRKLKKSCLKILFLHNFSFGMLLFSNCC